jgi:hypothetical protein
VDGDRCHHDGSDRGVDAMNALKRRLLLILIERVEARCMAADGPVTPTFVEMTDTEKTHLDMLTWPQRITSDAELRELWIREIENLPADDGETQRM